MLHLSKGIFSRTCRFLKTTSTLCLNTVGSDYELMQRRIKKNIEIFSYTAAKTAKLELMYFPWCNVRPKSQQMDIGAMGSYETFFSINSYRMPSTAEKDNKPCSWCRGIASWFKIVCIVRRRVTSFTSRPLHLREMNF
jgi:hypothetical protein